MKLESIYSAVFTFVIIILSHLLLAGSAEAAPPPAILKIDGNEQTSGIGNNCWKVENQTFSLCSDTFSIITPKEPLLTRSPFTALICLPFPPEELEFSTFHVTDDDELKEAANGVRAWNIKGNALNRYRRPLEREPDINLTLPPGLYVFNVFARWEGKGDASYGFLVQVNNSVAEAKTQAAAPISPPEYRFVWEPGENLSFTWTKENFDGFYYDAQSRTGNESITIKLDNLTDRWIAQNNMVYSTSVEEATARYSPFGEYAVIGFMGQKYLAGFPEGKSNITPGGGINLKPLYKILIDEKANYTLTSGSNLTFKEGYVLKVKELNVEGAQIALSLIKEDIEVDKKTIDTGKNYVYEIRDRPVIAVHIDSIHKEKETASAVINGIFQISEQYTSVNERDIFGVMKIINISDAGITMSNFLPVNLKRGGIIEIIGDIKLKVADSNTLRIHLYSDCDYEKSEHRGAAGTNKLSSWGGMNYAGFWYDVDFGNYSESLEITNITVRTIPQGGLTYTSHSIRTLYPVTMIKGKKPPGTDGSYLIFRLWGNNYAIIKNGLARILVGQGDCIYDKKTLLVGPNEFNGDVWELGEGYNLTAVSINFSENPYEAQLLLSRNGVVLDDIWLPRENVYEYTLPGENGYPKLITYLDAIFSGTTFDMIQLRYTWFVSDNVIQIKEGDRFGVFNVMVVEPDRMVLTNMEPIELKAGSSIDLLGNLSFFVENSDELRFYPVNNGRTRIVPGEVTMNEMPDISDSTVPVVTISPGSPVSGRTGKTPGFEAVLSITIILALYIAGRKLR